MAGRRNRWSAGRGRQLLRQGGAVLAAVALVVVANAGVSSGSMSGPLAVVDPRLEQWAATSEPVAVIVQGEPDQSLNVEQAVADAGGQITEQLSIVNGVAAMVPGDELDELALSDGVRVISLDEGVTVGASAEPAGTTTSEPTAMKAQGKSVYTAVAGAEEMRRAGLTGRGVTVALVDTGIADVPDLAGRVLPVRDDLTGTTSSCLNLSGEPGCSDSYGHGTFLAGLIAGNGASSQGAQLGMAPEANIVSIKIAGRDGSADVSTVLAAIQWVVSFKDRYGIRVLNLSLGTDSTQSYRVDPLNYAVERAWGAGVAVVVSASNRGPTGGTISKPADDPWVITVGAIDDRGTRGAPDDHLPNFSGRGPTVDQITKPDIVAPGAHLVSLRAPGSAIDEAFPNSVEGAYRRGSGTSMAAAVVSGGAALMLQAAPDMSPDRLKFALAATAQPAASSDPNHVGSGLVDVYGATFAAPAGTAIVRLPPSNGSGSLVSSRGTVLVRTNDPVGTILNGLLTAQLLLWDPIRYTTGNWSAPSWYTTTWYTSSWYRTTWHGSNWQGSNWQGSTWYGQRDDTSTYGSNWQGSTWYGAWE